VKLKNKERLMKYLGMLWGVCFILFCANNAWAIMPSEYDNYSANQLFQASWDSPSRIEKKQICAYLAKNRSDTAEGLFAQAWIWGYEKNRKMQNKYYNMCFSKFPDFLPAMFNHTIGTTKENALKNLKIVERALSIDPTFNEYQFVNIGYANILKSALKDYDGAEKFLEKWEARLGSDNYVFDYLRGNNQYYRFHNYKKALSYYASAIQKKGGPKNFDLWESYIDLQINELFDPSTQTANDKMKILAKLFRHAKDSVGTDTKAGRQFNYQVYVYVNDQLNKMGNKDSSLYFEAYKIYPTVEMAEKGFNSLIKGQKSNRYERGFMWLNSALKDLPDNPDLLAVLGWASTKTGKLGKARAYYQKAIDQVLTQRDKWNFTEEYVRHVLWPSLQYEKAVKLVQPFVGNYREQWDILASLARSETLLKKYDSSQARIAGIKALTKSEWADKLNASIGVFKKNDTEIKNFKENRFEGKWRQRHGESLKFAINFAVNSAKIPAQDFYKLEKIAGILAEQGSEQFVFRIEGHTDSTGSDKINDPLSKKRAQSVVDFLRQRYNVPFVRMDSSGFGSRRPIASNLTASGRAENRRVEVMLSGNMAQPELAVTTTMTLKAVDISSDGKYLLMRKENSYDFELWDVQAFRKIRELPGMRNRPLFSPNNRYIAYTGSFAADIGTLTIVDVQTGQRIAQRLVYGHPGTGISWSPFGDEIAFATDMGYLMKYHLASEKITQIKRIKNFTNRGTIVWTPNGRYISLMQKNWGGDVQVYAAKNLSFMKSLKPFRLPHSLGVTSNSRYLVCEDNQRLLHVWDLENNFEHKSMKVPVLSSRMSAHPAKNHIILNDWGGRDHNKAAIVDLDRMAVIAQKDIGSVESAKYYYLNDGAQIIMVSDKTREIRLLDPKNLNDTLVYSGESAPAEGKCYADNQNHHLVTHDKEGLHVWDVKTGKKIHGWLDKVYGILAYPNMAHQFIGLVKDTKNKKTRVMLYDFANFTKKELLTVGFIIDRWGIQAGGLLLTGTPYMPLHQGAKKGVVQLYDLKTLKLQNEILVAMPTAMLKYPRLYSSRFTGMEMSPDKTKVALATAWGDGWKTGETKTKVTRVFSLETGSELQKLPVTGDLGFLENHLLEIGESIYNINTGAYVRKKNKNDKLPYPYNIAYHSSFKKGSAEFKDLNLKIIPDYNNTIEFLNLKNENLILTIAAKRNNQWIAYAPGGKFSASLNGTNKVYWRVGDRFLPFNALKKQFETPKIIQQMLKAAVTGTIPEKKKEKPEIDPDLFKAPYKIALTDDRDVQTRKNNYLLKVNVTKESADLPDPDLEFTLNGRVVKKSRGFEIVPVKKGPTTVDITRKFDLQTGLNVIQVSLVYKNARLQTQSVRVNKNDPQQSPERMSHVQLWFFGVGVSDYENPEQNLDYAHKDVLDLADSLKIQEGKLFQKVNIKTLVNENATEKSVRIQMHRFLKQASSQDVIMIFLAGHGVQDNEQNLYFMTHDGLLEDPYTGMEFDKFESFLKSRPINQKAILMLDICHAGSAGLKGKRRGKVTAEEAVKQLSEGTGTIVFASSTGKESSLESDEYGGGHGAFTAALLEGIKGQADRVAGNSDKYIGIFELVSYVSRRVPQLTDGDQHPTTPQSINVRDFPISTY